MGLHHSCDRKVERIASISKELLNFTDAYVLDVFLLTPSTSSCLSLPWTPKNAAGTRKKGKRT